MMMSTRLAVITQSPFHKQQCGCDGRREQKHLPKLTGGLCTVIFSLAIDRCFLLTCVCEAGGESPVLMTLWMGVFTVSHSLGAPLGGALNTFVFTFGVKYITLCDVCVFLKII